MLNKFIYTKLGNEYVNSFNMKDPESQDHLEKLRLLKQYLDSKGYLMPKPKWKFDYDNLDTWPLLPGRMLRDKTGSPIQHKTFKNHNFKYKHLL